MILLVSLHSPRLLHFDVLTLVFQPSINTLAVAGAECNTVIELKLEHHAA